MAEDTHRELIRTITLNTLNKPRLDVDKELLYCLNLYTQTMALNAGLLNTVLNESFIFEWKKDAVDLSLNQEEIEINEAGIYKVIVTNENNCST